MGKRRSRRPLSTKEPLHLTLRSERAQGGRCLLKHRPLIERTIQKASRRFCVRVYEQAICSNHLHLLVYGKSRQDLQNFFRVVAGHIAQAILREFPLSPRERGGAPGGKAGHPKNRRQFWALLLYSRVLTWGREFKSVKKYVIQNILEALGAIAYKPRKHRRNTS